MDLNLHQGIVQQPKLILTSEMRQSLKILQMPLFELQQDISRELDENPLLEVIAEQDATDDESKSAAMDDNPRIDRYIQETETFQTDNLNYRNDDHEWNNPLDFVTARRTLKDYLLEQILDLNEEQPVITICDYIIENIDERGYLSCQVEEIANELMVTVDRVNYALELVQDFQPWGVAARSLKECLKIQLRKKQVLDEPLYRMVEECLELLADNKVKEIAGKLNLEVEKAQQYCRIIKSLEPKPARGFYTGASENFIIPEAYIMKSSNELLILMNDTALPRLTINQLYKDILRKNQDEQALDFIKNKLNSAIYLIKDIEHRKRTIYNVLEKIIELQHDYFEHGEQYLKPMTIGDIASQLKLHESTISRAIRDKYICTPFNTIKLKDLFTVGVGSGLTEEMISAQLVKREIRKLIASEDKTQPLSDQDISDKLKNTKIEISRRTVAKYREEMAIGSSSKRRVF